MKRNLAVIKVGGDILDQPDALRNFLSDFVKIKCPKILVHGGGKLVTDLGEKLGIKPRLIDGRRVTDKATLDLAKMVYGGLIGKSLVASLQALRCNAVGLSGADCNIIEAVKRPVRDIDYGMVGDIVRVNTDPIENFLARQITPLFAALTHDGQGQILNTNADTVAASLAIALTERYRVALFLCFEKKGVLKSVENESSLIRRLDRDTYGRLKANGRIATGMIAKLDNAFSAIERGVDTVTVCNAGELILWIKSGREIGTNLTI